ncbi:hypothetical protein OPQ81_000528 [Rhizoctonia solani]|nr:hypothetical protein OPQ81_000528 [Rhizoctonia solani]
MDAEGSRSPGKNTGELGESNTESGIRIRDLWSQELEGKWNKLQECLSKQDDYQTIELTIDSLVTQLEEEGATTLENHLSTLGSCDTSTCDPYRGGWMSNLGASYLSQFRRSGDPEDLTLSISYQLKALESTPQENENTPNIMCNLGNSYHTRFLRMNDRADIDRSIEFYTQAMGLTPQGHASRPAQLQSLGQSHFSCFREFGEISDIEKAIELQRQALELAHPNDPNVPGWLNNLADSYTSRFDRLGHSDDINKAIELLNRAIHLTPNGHANLPTWLTTLGNAHRSRFTREGNLGDINDAIEYQSQAVLATPDGHAYKRVRLSHLGGSYLSRFKHLGNLEDLEKAIRFLSQALKLTPRGVNQIGLLIDLGNSYGLKFERLGQLSDVDEAINYLILAETLATNQHAIMPDVLTSLGFTYLRRFERLRNLGGWHANRGLFLNNLGRSHAQRFSHSGKREDLENAVVCLTQATSLLPENHPGMPGILHNLAHLLDIHPDSTLGAIDAAVDYQTRAVSLTPEEHVQLPNFINSLGLLYRRRYKKQGKLEDIEQAIQWLAVSVALTPEEHARMPLWLTNLGESHLEQYKKQKHLSSLFSAIECYRRCAQRPAVFPYIQLHAAFTWGKLASIPGLPFPEDESLKAYQVAMDLVPHAVWLGTKIGKRYKDAQNIKNLASSAAAVAITVQKYDLAIEWLEQGRSVVWNQMLQLRNPLDDLATIDPFLATNLRQVAADLSEASLEYENDLVLLNDVKSQVEDDFQKHHRLAEKYQDLVTAARRLPGFNDFLRPAKVSALARAAKTGSLVVINIDVSRCDALVIRPGSNEITHIPLSDLSVDKISSIRAELDVSLRLSHVRERGIKLKSSPQGKPEYIFERVLATLWTSITRPVLDALGYKPTIGELPHITWCTTGALSFLPLHASGYYDRPQAKLSDYAVSSYTPTLGILLSASSSTSKSTNGILAVGQVSTPGMTPLPGTKKELANIEKHVQEPLVYSQLDGYKATGQAVLSAMERHSWVHLACHAYQNTRDPIKSGFFLHEDTLYLEQISRVSFQNKGLAFLSACQTATGDKELPDEAIHLASGMLMAGYSSVIATMWSIMDEDAPLIADEVYARLLKGGRMDVGGAANALHQAVCQLREKVGDRAFSRWVPYIHMGGYGNCQDT